MKALLAALLALVVGAGACAPELESLTPEDDDVGEIRAARETLGDPILRLAGALIRATELLDAVRHEIPRGEGMREAAAGAGGEVGRLRDAADDAAQAADSAGLGDAVADAAEIVTVAAEDGRAAADALAEEARMLVDLADVDIALEAAVGEWDAPGAQTERRETLLAQAEAARALADRAGDIDPAPPGCTRLRDNRVRWADLVADRTERLAEAATAAGGATYDELRDAFRRRPFGEDRRAADAADAGCWQQASVLAQAAEVMHERVAEIEDALS